MDKKSYVEQLSHARALARALRRAPEKVGAERSPHARPFVHPIEPLGQPGIREKRFSFRGLGQKIELRRQDHVGDR